MKNYTMFSNDIDANKKKIAVAISLAFFDGNYSKSSEIFPFIYKYVEEAKTFVFKINSIENEYTCKINDLLNEISKLIGYSVNDKFFYNKTFDRSDSFYTSSNISDIEESLLKKLHRQYFSCVKTFSKLNISYDEYINRYKCYGEEYIFKLADLISKLEKSSFMYKFKNWVSGQKELYEFKVELKEVENLLKEYNLFSSNDLLDFYSEVNSILIDERDLNDYEKGIVEQNRSKLLYRVKDPSIIDNVSLLKDIKNKIEKIYSNKMMENCLNRSNLNDFFEKYKFDFTADNFSNLIKWYCYAYTVDGFHVSTKFDGISSSICFFNSAVFEECSEYQNIVIIHELIHSIECCCKEGINRFNVKCKYLNEALTHYFTLEALKYIDINIVNDNNIIKKQDLVDPYDCLLPLIDILKNSSFWDYFVEAKIKNDYCVLENRLGKAVKEISQIFDDTFLEKSILNEDMSEEKEKQLFKIINDIDKKIHKKK